MNETKKGLRDGIPICLGYFSVAFAFGIFCVNSGLSPLQATLISMTNVTSAGQLAAVPIMTNAGTFIELALAQLVHRSRFPSAEDAARRDGCEVPDLRCLRLSW